ASEGTIPRRRLVPAQGLRVGREEVGDDVHRLLAGLVARDVNVVAGVEEALAGVAHDGRAVWVVPFVEGHCALDHRDEDRARVTVPAALTTWLEDDHLGRDVNRGTGIDSESPVLVSVTHDRERTLEAGAAERSGCGSGPLGGRRQSTGPRDQKQAG